MVLGECVEVLRNEIEDCSIDSLVTDPPAGISFMGKDWDKDKGGRDNWVEWMTEVMKECYRVLKPGAHGLVWAIPRTSHWTATACENAGFEIRDCIYHIQGAGFPKSLNLEKAMDKAGMLCQCCANEKKETAPPLPHLSEGIHTEKPNCTKQGEILQQTMLCEMEVERRKNQGTTPFDCAERPIRLDGIKSEVRVGKNEWKEKSCMEGGKVYRTGQRICHGPCSESPQGEEERVCMRTHTCHGKKDRSQSEKRGRHSSHKSQPTRQPGEKPDSLQRSQIPLGGTPFEGLCCRKCGKVERSKIKGYGTALKPAVECYWLLRKPLSEKTVAKNVLKWGTGGINIDGCRIESGEKLARPFNDANNKTFGKYSRFGNPVEPQGRFPANLVLSGDAPEMLDKQSGELKGPWGKDSKQHVGKDGETSIFGCGGVNSQNEARGMESGGASRFFYCAKASKAERNAGLEGMTKQVRNTTTGATRPNKPARLGSDPHKKTEPTENHHPTVKTIKLMRYLCRLITPPGGTVLDPFMGSGTTGIAAHQEGFEFFGIESCSEYFEIAKKRIKYARKNGVNKQFRLGEL